MIVCPLLAVSFIMSIMAAIFVFSCIVLILIVLIQKGKGGGLSGALAGGMAGGLLGTKTGDFLTWVTIGLVGVFLFLAVVLAKFYKPEVSEYNAPDQQQSAPAEQQKSEVPAQPTPAAPGANTPAQ